VVGVDVVDWRSRGARTEVQKFGLVRQRPACVSGAWLRVGPRSRVPTPRPGHLWIPSGATQNRRSQRGVLDVTPQIPGSTKYEWSNRARKADEKNTATCFYEEASFFQSHTETPCHAWSRASHDPPVSLPYSVQPVVFGLLHFPCAVHTIHESYHSISQTPLSVDAPVGCSQHD
jgi:hypothetical protein